MNLQSPEELREDTVSLYAKHLNPGLAKLMSFAGFPVEMRAEGSYVYDENGEGYLDFLGGYGVFSCGHRHPHIIQAVKDQLDVQALSAKAFFNPVAARLAARLTSLAPAGLDYAFFVNSGAEAVEAALKFARVATGRTKFLATEGAYHGKTFGALTVTGRKKYQTPFEPLVPVAEFVPYGDFEAASKALTQDVAAFIVEPIQGEGGIVVPPDGYLTHLRSECDRVGALLIVDEVQTGLGRTGDLFAVNREGVRPDLMTLAKALGGGVMPIGANLGTAAIWERVFSENPLIHTNTFGGNPLACAAALATLDVLESEQLVERSRHSGQILLEGLQEVAIQRADLIADARGRGLMIGVEFREDEVGELVVAQLLKRHMFVAYTLNNPRVLRFEPPLNMAEEHLHDGVRLFAEALDETADLLAFLD